MFFSEGIGIAELPEKAGSALVKILTSALDHAWPLRDQVLEKEGERSRPSNERSGLGKGHLVHCYGRRLCWRWWQKIYLECTAKKTIQLTVGAAAPKFVVLGLILLRALYLFWTQKLRTDITALLGMLTLGLPRLFQACRPQGGVLTTILFLPILITGYGVRLREAKMHNGAAVPSHT